eukprot:c15092_g1_i1.p1 GENE.c15092_g1_i1~~c15092_g1_i1.p1  ORF type:complete len:177 (-),score=42.95 c15092_g1_i1:39-569(-)
MGSTDAFDTCVALSLEAHHVTVFEYNPLTFTHPNITTVTLANARANWDHFKGKFDVVVSMSSFDHDGLGRYNDPIDPNGDLRAMNEVKQLLTPNGILVLSLPVATDILVWNMMRIYGKVRLPMILEGWTVVDRFGWDENRYGVPPEHVRVTYEPCWVLRPIRHDAPDTPTANHLEL